MGEYFACAAEDILKDVYGEKYDTFFAAQTAEFGEKAKKNSPGKNAEQNTFRRPKVIGDASCEVSPFS